MSQENVEVVLAATDAINKRDPDANADRVARGDPAAVQLIPRSHGARPFGAPRRAEGCV
jgi:hypothetical protein